MRSTTLVLLGIGLGALIVAVRSAPRADEPPTLRGQADALRARTREAQLESARTSKLASDLLSKWSAAEDAARKEGLG